MTMKKLFLVCVSFAALSSFSSYAADLPAQPYSKAAPYADPVDYWTGFHIGLNGGGAFGSNGTGDAVSFTPGNAPFIGGGFPDPLNAKHQGGFGGVQFGYDWQLGRSWVFGLETDIQGSSIGGTTTTVFPGSIIGVPSLTTARDHIDWFGTFRARFGALVGNDVLFYATGGAAYGGVSTDVTDTFTPAFFGVYKGSASDTRVGWSAGFGVERALTSNWFLRGEYLHIDLGKSNVTIADPLLPPPDSVTYSFHHVADTIRVALDYKFGGPVAARY